jgi:hypothetical protein
MRDFAHYVGWGSSQSTLVFVKKQNKIICFVVPCRASTHDIKGVVSTTPFITYFQAFVTRESTIEIN